MMNPLQYLMSQMSKLHNETAVLEVCDWDEEKVDKLIENLNAMLIDVDASLEDNLKRFCDGQEYITPPNRELLYGLLEQSIIMELKETAEAKEEYEN
jgi:hypothetical protein